jgi:hypothetical protein
LKCYSTGQEKYDLKSVLIRGGAFGKKDFIRGGGTNVLYFCNISFKIINTTSGSKQQNIELYCIYYLLCHKQVINKTIKHINTRATMHAVQTDCWTKDCQRFDCRRFD